MKKDQSETQEERTYLVKGGDVEILVPFIQIPPHIATCPDCGGALEALVNVLDRVEVGAYRYRPSIPTIYCQNETPNDHHSDQNGDEWMNTYDKVGEWLETDVVAEFEAEDFDGAAPPEKLGALWRSLLYKPN